MIMAGHDQTRRELGRIQVNPGRPEFQDAGYNGEKYGTGTAVHPAITTLLGFGLFRVATIMVSVICFLHVV